MKIPISRIKAFAAFALLVCLVVGIPTLLSIFVGSPVASSFISVGDIQTALSDGFIPDAWFITALATIAWLLWLQLTIALVLEVVAATGGRPTKRLVGFGPSQLLVATLLTLLMSGTHGSKTTTQPLSLAVLRSVAVTPIITQADEPVAPEAIAPESNQSTRTYVVKRRDTLWGIAERECGDPQKWREIYSLNQGSNQPNGEALVSADFIKPGWTLQLPVLADQCVAPTLPSSAPTAVAVPAPALDTQPDLQATPLTEAATPTTTTSPSEAISTAPELHLVPSVPEKKETAAISPSDVEALKAAMSISLCVAIAVIAARLLRRRRISYTPSAPLGDVLNMDSLSLDLTEALSTSEATTGPLSDPQSVSALLERLTDSSLVSVDQLRHLVVEVSATMTSAEVEIVVVSENLGRAIGGFTSDLDGIRVLDDVDSTSSYLQARLIERKRVAADLEAGDFDALCLVAPDDATQYLVVGDSEAGLSNLASFVETNADWGFHLVKVDGAEARSEQHDEVDEKPVPSLTSGQAEALMFLVHEDSEAPSAPAVVQRDGEKFEAPDIDGKQIVRLNVFGEPELVVSGEHVTGSLRSKSIELAALLALHPKGLKLETITAALWPDASDKQGRERFATVVSNLRKALRNTTGLNDERFVLHDHVYRLDVNHFSCDLWDFERALERSSVHDNGQQLAQAVAVYQGDFCGSAYPDWALVNREHFRRRFLDACVALSEIELSKGRDDSALTVLERAIEADPYAEELYRRVMTIQMKSTGLGSARRTFQLLVRQLEALGCEPDERTKRVLRNADRQSLGEGEAV